MGNYIYDEKTDLYYKKEVEDVKSIDDLLDEYNNAKMLYKIFNDDSYLEKMEEVKEEMKGMIDNERN
jgi:hypothetical protein